MVTVIDFQGRPYSVLDIGPFTTLLECNATHEHVRIRNWDWNEIGFIKP